MAMVSRSEQTRSPIDLFSNVELFSIMQSLSDSVTEFFKGILYGFTSVFLTLSIPFSPTDNNNNVQHSESISDSSKDAAYAVNSHQSVEPLPLQDIKHDMLLEINKNIENIISEKVDQLNVQRSDLVKQLTAQIYQTELFIDDLKASQNNLKENLEANLALHLNNQNEKFQEQQSYINDLKIKQENLIAKLENLKLESVHSFNDVNVKLNANLRSCCEDNLNVIQSLIEEKIHTHTTSQSNSKSDELEILRRKIEELVSNIDAIHMKLEEVGSDTGNSKDYAHHTTDTHNTQGSDIRKLIKEELAIYDADKIAEPDYALEPSGGEIISTRCTENYNLGTATISILGFPIWHPTISPRVVITPGTVPGQCWAFQGFPGFLVIKLIVPIHIGGFTLEHIPKRLAPMGNIDSAPQNFSVWGLVNETDREPLLLGQYVYDQDGDPLQRYAVQNNDAPPFQMIELRIESNHGNIYFTCLYRFRVHGRAVTESKPPT